jgi:DNA-binding Lrp family transcriptional regulator
VAWLSEMDRILIVGMKHGPQGIREATNKVLALRTGLTRADCWKRLRSLRAAGNHSHPAPRNWPPEVKALLREGYQQGGEKKRQVIKKVRELYPGLPSNAPSRFARRQGWLPKSTQTRARRLWTEHEERKLWELAGYETAARIAERLGRSEGAVRFRLKSLGMSVKVKDGWSFRALQELLHAGPAKLRRFIADTSLRVRDPRISAKSLVALREDRIAAGSAPTEPVEGAPRKLLKNANGYSWGSAAKLLGVDVGQVREWIVEGKLKIVDKFVTERAFQDFCKKRGSELNSALLGNDVHDWLVEGYSLPVDVDTGASSISGNQKHALVTRRCPECRRPMRGNIFFRHIKTCNRRPPTEHAFVVVRST